MAINFTDSPADGATQVISGKTYTYNSAKNKWDTTATEVTGPTATTYATVNDLPGTATAGDQAFVSGTNRLYIWNGSGWYNIALINNTPTWTTQPASSYALEIDGTATVVSIVASDPEGLPITYSITSDTSGNVATVVQGTGLNTNSWTITPSTSNADAGTFSLTFRASDGINIASAISSFTLQFKVVNSHYTSALITSVGANNAVNNSFDDKSTSNHTITAAGNATQTTFSPYRHGGYSTYFDGSGDYLTVASSTEHDFGTGDFCVEFWWWPETVTGNSAGLHIALSSPANSTTQLGYDEGGRKLYFYNNDNGGNIIQNTGVTPTVKAWNHIALCRSGTTVSLYLNGTRAGTATHTSNVSFSGLQIGRYTAGGYEIDGYVRDVRLVKGSSIYDATQASLTVPTEPLTAITNTTLLTCHLPYIADGSTTGHSIAVNGNTKTEPFAPYDAQQYSAASHLGSASFDGTGDYLHMPQTSLDLGSDNFCVEAWVYTTSTANQAIVGSYRYADGVGSWNLNVNYNSKKVRFFIRHSGGTVLDGQFESGTFPTNQWVHVAVTRDGANLRAFINGTQAGSTNTSLGSSSIDNAVTTYRIGSSNDNNIYCNGNIADVRVVKGSSVYTADFTPTTVPLTAITNTIFLAQSTDAGIIDKSQSVKSITLAGNTKSSTAQTKYLTSSIYVDGTGDYILLDDSGDLHDMFAADFTIEGWYYPSTTPGNSVTAVFSKRANGSTTGGVLLYFAGADTTPSLLVDTGGSWGINSACSSGFTVGQWNHFAVTRNGSAFKVFIDGSSVLSVSSSATIPNNTSKFGIGTMGNDGSYAMPAAYFSDIRITKGLARYTSNFTAPTAALQG